MLTSVNWNVSPPSRRKHVSNLTTSMLVCLPIHHSWLQISLCTRQTKFLSVKIKSKIWRWHASSHADSTASTILSISKNLSLSTSMPKPSKFLAWMVVVRWVRAKAMPSISVTTRLLSRRKSCVRSPMQVLLCSTKSNQSQSRISLRSCNSSLRQIPTTISTTNTIIWLSAMAI